MSDFIKKMIDVRPSERQIAWQKLEYTAFFHFGINTFSDKEWGDGTEDISIFNPVKLNTDDWCETLKNSGIKACLFTAKHHDGFCNWDTKFTDHNVMNTPLKKDILAMLCASCKKYGLKLGVYLSPWDRHEKTYGFGSAYNDFFCSQLTELLTNYGDIYTVWFDGACGEGANGKKQVYDWERYYSIIRKLQPNAVISVCGPDVRWCGNEAGKTRKSEWSTVPAYMQTVELIQEKSQQEDSTDFREKLTSTDEDLGSREVLKNCEDIVWYPSEVDTSIRPGWFFHAEEQPRPLKDLVEIYINSVGGNSLLLLNIPPNTDGLIDERDKKRLAEVWEEVKKFSVAENLEFDYAQTENDIFEYNVKLKTSCMIKYAVLAEDIAQSQRVETFKIYAKIASGDFICVYEGTTIGYKKIAVLAESVHTDEIKVEIIECRSQPKLLSIAVI